MFRILVGLFLITTPQVSANCEFGRTEGLFSNDFQNTGEDNHVPDDGGDSLAPAGDSMSVTFDNNLNIFSAQVNTLKIYDTGLIFVAIPTGGAEDGLYDMGDDPFNKVPGQSFIAPFWFSVESGVEFRFMYKHLKRSELIDAAGLAIGPSLCDLQRVENIIADCNDAGENQRNPEGDAQISEALIVTWQFFEGSQAYHMQAVVAIDSKTVDDDRETYVIFLYEDINNIPGTLLGSGGALTGFINGLYASTGLEEFAAVCPYNSNIMASIVDIAELHLMSNCRCGSWNQGIYVFRTRDDQLTTYEGSTCLKQTETDLMAECARPLTDDDTMTFQLACRPPRKPQDTCIEDIYCAYTATANQAFVQISMHRPAYLHFIFLDYTDILAGTLTLETSGVCKLLMTETTAGSELYLGTITIDTTSPNCGFVYNDPDELNFALMIYDINDGTDVEIIKRGSLILKGTCKVLDNKATVKVQDSGIPTTQIPLVMGRNVELFVNDKRGWNPLEPESKFLTTTVVDLARDIYLAVGYNWGDRAPYDNAEPYGVYTKTTLVSNNADFLTTGTGRVEELTEDTGCRSAYSMDQSNAFYTADHFKEVFFTTVISTTDYNHIQMSGALHAAKWIVGDSDTIFFRVTIGFCRTQTLRASSKCADSCGGQYIDYPARKRRDTNDTSGLDASPYPDVTIETSIRIKKPSQPGTAEQIECVSSTVAIATLVVLMVLLLFAVAIAALLFRKVKTRQKKV